MPYFPLACKPGKLQSFYLYNRLIYRNMQRTKIKRRLGKLKGRKNFPKRRFICNEMAIRIAIIEKVCTFAGTKTGTIMIHSLHGGVCSCKKSCSFVGYLFEM